MWTRLDDEFYDRPKIVDAGNELAGVYCRSLSYCGRHLTDGKVPSGVARTIAGTKRIEERMVAAELWIRNGTGYLIPDYLQFNPSREKVELSRRTAAERKAKSRGSHKGRTP